MDAQPNDELVQEPASEASDVEGHSVLSVIATSGVLHGSDSREKQAASKKADEALPPLTKQFPSMREDHRK